MTSGARTLDSYCRSIWHQAFWWKWVILGHVAFVAIKVHLKFFNEEPWLRLFFKPFDLGSEMNYAVWWSGICLFIAAILFHRCKCSGNNISRKVAWSFLSIFAMGLAIDEIGSFHEKIIKAYGFSGLLPFALVIGGCVSYSIFNLYRNVHTRMSSILVSLAILSFIVVAGLEWVEHNIIMSSSLIKPARLVLEEALELTGTTLLIFSGLIALPAQENEPPELVFLVGSSRGMTQLNFVVFLFYIMHLVFYFGTLNIDAWSFRAGNPISAFPITIFFLGSLRCLYLAKYNVGNFYHYLLVLAVLLLLVSIGQTMNLAIYFGEIAGMKPPLFIEDMWSWLATLLPFALLALTLIGRKIIRFTVILVSIIIVLVIMIWAFNQSPRIATYYLHSGTVAYACFILLDTSSTSFIPYTKSYLEST